MRTKGSHQSDWGGNSLGVSVELAAAVAEDGPRVEIILHRDEDEPDSDDESGHLVVQPEQRTVDHQPVLLEILKDLLQNRQLVFEARRHFDELN